MLLLSHRLSTFVLSIFSIRRTPFIASLPHQFVALESSPSIDPPIPSLKNGDSSSIDFLPIPSLKLHFEDFDGWIGDLGLQEEKPQPSSIIMDPPIRFPKDFDDFNGFISRSTDFTPIPSLNDVEDFNGLTGNCDLQEEQPLLSSSIMYAALAKRRRDQFNEGIGIRFVCHTAQLPLKVYKAPPCSSSSTYLPYAYNGDDSGFVGVLREGEIVTSIGPRFGPWVQHDHGGWSLSVEDGFRWLQPINE